MASQTGTTHLGLSAMDGSAQRAAVTTCASSSTLSLARPARPVQQQHSSLQCPRHLPGGAHVLQLACTRLCSSSPGAGLALAAREAARGLGPCSKPERPLKLAALGLRLPCARLPLHSTQSVWQITILSAGSLERCARALWVEFSYFPLCAA